MPPAVNRSVVNNTRTVDVKMMEIVFRCLLGTIAAVAISFRVQQVGCPTMAQGRFPLRYNQGFMSQTSQAITRTPAEVVRTSPVSQASNGICYATMGEIATGLADLERMVLAVPRTIAAALNRKAYYFVPLTLNMGEDTLIADRYDVQLSDSAVCHRNQTLGDSHCVFISTRLMEDSFAIAFEFFINIGHNFVESVGVSQEFADLVWKQVDDKVRGETSLDAYELRKVATTAGPEAEKAKHEYLLATFADAIAVYSLSLFLDVDYQDLRERDYPLLAPVALAERLRKINDLFPPNPGFEFGIYHRRRQS
jgi:hypothetical protein